MLSWHIGTRIEVALASADVCPVAPTQDDALLWTEAVDDLSFDTYARRNASIALYCMSGQHAAADGNDLSSATDKVKVFSGTYLNGLCATPTNVAWWGPPQAHACARPISLHMPRMFT